MRPLRTKIIYLLFLSFSLYCFTSFFPSEILYSKEEPVRDDAYEELELFGDVITIVRKSYVDEVSFKSLIYGGLTGMLRSLDPHSQFLTPEMYKEMQVDTEGKFGGLGLEISIRGKFLTIIAPIEGTPAYEAGIEPGDIIVKIDGESTEKITLMGAIKNLRGKKGTDVKLTILRPATREVKTFTLTRSIIKIKSVKDPLMLSDTIGYVRIIQFQENTTADLKKALDGLLEESMKGLILDMRNNPGGLLEEAVATADIFLEKGKLIVSTKGRLAEQNIKFVSRQDNKDHRYPVVILVNGGSASGAEIVAGALRDWNRAVIVGTTTFGKGSVQNLLPLKDGSGIRLTTAKYFTPSGKTIHNIGITPDIVVPFKPLEPDKKTEENENEMLDLYNSTVETVPENAHTDIRTQIIDDTQIQRAYDLLQGLLILQGTNEPPHDGEDKTA